MNYEKYLEQNNYSKTTIEHYLKRFKEFTAWSKKYGIKATEIDYKTCLKYVKYLQQKRIQVQTINNHIVTLRNYFDYLIEANKRAENPIEEVSVKGTVKRVMHNLLDADELEDLYYSFETDSFNKYSNYKARLSAKRNKIITGLIVYQGLNTTNLKSLLLEHLQLYKGKIYVPSTRRNNAREMELKPWQVMNLLEYINEIRPEIAKYNQIHSDELLIPQNHFNDLVQRGIVKRLKAINQKAGNINHLRASVIVNWLKQFNMRKVQYLAGHKYISSTESYKQNNLESLHEAVNEFHPLS
ncbi:tyrosine-type recombinase/integrase [Zunongwangia pacifica]|uniref:Tyrosine-type recombinase/integrase n=1 Tax=Zunongwangia pacifica TaxID=2911062 RepID=A0A9X2CLL8_9FLAO|nr:tyrosine-type recombinase/integrase [Zunongwangia pacifica]MCL6220156.1 tyrosine-type recombinase/integrase [Zunongwangia pacifica]